jgi:hypothetical protein
MTCPPNRNLQKRMRVALLEPDSRPRKFRGRIYPISPSVELAKHQLWKRREECYIHSMGNFCQPTEAKDPLFTEIEAACKIP